jgi:hypothetical protein
MTGLTYRNRDQERNDRRQQEQLLAALDAAPSQLSRDECGSWIIAGRRGTIHTWGDGKTWGAYVIGRSTRHWTMIQRRLAFMTVTQDGDEEGCLRLLALPTPAEAALIRDALLLRKRRTLTEEFRASLIAAGVNGRFRADTAAAAPGSVSERRTTLSREKSTAIASINAVAVTEPEEVA